MFDRRPAVIVRPTTHHGRRDRHPFRPRADLELAVRSGGHSAAGHSTCDGGLVVDLSRMRGVSVDPATRGARVNGGALLGELDVAAQAHGLVCPTGVIGHTGVAGLTLGGGVGRLQRRFGLTIDNLRAVELVTADGRLVRASETEEPDLFWGMRGAGWNFGIVTAFEFGLQPFGPDCIEASGSTPRPRPARSGRSSEDYAAAAPETVSMIYGIGRPSRMEYRRVGRRRPDRHRLVQPQRCADAVERDTAGLRRGPEPLGQRRQRAVPRGPDRARPRLGWGGRSFIKGLYADAVRPEALDALLEHVAAGPSGGSFSVTVAGRSDRRGSTRTRWPSPGARQLRPERRHRLGRRRRR